MKWWSISIVVLGAAACSDSKPAEERETQEQAGLYDQIASELLELSADDCDEDSLQPLEKRRTLSVAERSRWKSVLATADGDKLARRAFEYAEKSSDPADLFDRTLMFLLWESAQRGSALGENEVGAALMNCHNGVARDDDLAALWLRRAADQGDALAMMSLSELHLSGRLRADSSVEEGERLLRRCTQLGNTECLERLNSLAAERNSAGD